MKRLRHFTSTMLQGLRARRKSSGGGWNVGAVALSALRACRAADHCAGGGSGGEGILRSEARDSYFNELIAWRELAVNFVRFTPQYDTVEVR